MQIKIQVDKNISVSDNLKSPFDLQLLHGNIVFSFLALCPKTKLVITMGDAIPNIPGVSLFTNSQPPEITTLQLAYSPQHTWGQPLH